MIKQDLPNCFTVFTISHLEIMLNFNENLSLFIGCVMSIRSNDFIINLIDNDLSRRLVFMLLPATLNL